MDWVWPSEMLAYYASIMLNAFNCLLCSKLCQHNLSRPTFGTVPVCMHGLMQNGLLTIMHVISE